MPKQYRLTSLLEKKYVDQRRCDLINIFKIVDESCNYHCLIHEHIDQMAKACHEHYQQNKKEGCPVSWNELDYFKRLSNFSQADHIDVKLRALAIKTESFDENDFLNNIQANNKEKLELLAELEHRRWMSVQIMNKKSHNLIKPWSELSESEKQIDRDHILAIGEILFINMN